MFAYTGEGQKGDMTFARGNRAIRDHMANGRDLLLFEAMKPKGLYRFVGCFGFAGWKVKPEDSKGKRRNSIVFELARVDDVQPTSSIEPIEAEPKNKSLQAFRAMALEAAATPTAPSKETQRTFCIRSARVKVYVLKRVNGFCEACKKPAPFLKKDGSLYLEPHHIKRVSDGGPDHPKSVGAVCPTCHRLIHHGDEGMKLNSELERYVLKIEQDLEDSSHAPFSS
jgi:5-methylcytosine-specific restriction enzyme A